LGFFDDFWAKFEKQPLFYAQKPFKRTRSGPKTRNDEKMIAKCYIAVEKWQIWAENGQNHEKSLNYGVFSDFNYPYLSRP
jgi:hypothetical protein